MTEITLKELEALDKSEAIIIDVRSRESFEYGSIENSINIPLDEIPRSELDKDTKIILCCQ